MSFTKYYLNPGTYKSTKGQGLNLVKYIQDVVNGVCDLQALAGAVSSPDGNTYIQYQNNNLQFYTDGLLAGSVTHDGTDFKWTLNGILDPKVYAATPITTTQRNAITPTSGYLIYNSDSAQFEYYNGSWNPVGSGGSVSTVFGRTGAIVSSNGDYNSSQITNTPSGNLTSTTVQDALNELQTEIDNLPTVDLNTTISNETGSNGTGLTSPSTPPAGIETGDFHIEVYDDVLLYFVKTVGSYSVVEVSRGSVPGIDDVLNVGQNLTTTRLINLNGNGLSLIGSTGGSISFGDNGIIQINSLGNTPFTGIRNSSGQFISLQDGTDDFGIYNFAGNPEGNVTANTGSTVHDTSNGVLYIKTTDTVNTGWEEVGFKNIVTADLTSTENRIHTFDNVLQIIGTGQKDILSSDGAGRTAFFRLNQGTADFYVSNTTGNNNSATGIQISNSTGVNASVELSATDPVSGKNSGVIATGDTLVINTPEVDAGNSTVGQILTLKQTNGDSEFTDLKYIQTFVTGDWVSDGVSNSTLSITATTHEKGLTPNLTIFEVSGVTATKVNVDYSYDTTTGDITITVLEGEEFNGVLHII